MDLISAAIVHYHQEAAPHDGTSRRQGQHDLRHESAFLERLTACMQHTLSLSLLAKDRYQASSDSHFLLPLWSEAEPSRGLQLSSGDLSLCFKWSCLSAHGSTCLLSFYVLLPERSNERQRGVALGHKHCQHNPQHEEPSTIWADRAVNSKVRKKHSCSASPHGKASIRLYQPVFLV